MFEVVSEAARSTDGRCLVEKTLRPLVRSIANPLKLGEMGLDATHFVLGFHWKNHFIKKAAETGGPVEVRHLRKWIDEPKPMGLPKEAENLVILTYAQQTNRSFFIHGAPDEATLGAIRDLCVLREQKLPPEAQWSVALERAGSIFGVAGSPLLNVHNVASLVAAVRKKVGDGRPGLPELLSEAPRPGRKLFALGDSDRLNTATATLRLLEKVHLSAEDAVIGALASAEVATSESAMGECLTKAGILSGTLDGTSWEMFEAIAELSDERKIAVWRSERDRRIGVALRRHEVARGQPEKEAQSKRAALLTIGPINPPLPPPTPDPTPIPPPPPPPPGRKVIDEGMGEFRVVADARAKLEELAKRTQGWATRSHHNDLANRRRNDLAMTAAAPTFSQIKAQVAAIRGKIPDARVIGIRASGRWTGDRRKEDGDETYLIEQCDSPLALRIALRADGGPRTTQVLITSLDEKELSDDILVRLAKRRLFPIDSWQIVKSLFQANAVDPRLMRHAWIADALMELNPRGGYPAASGGFLAAETVWPILLGGVASLADDRPDLLAILKWSIDADAVARFRGASAEFREAAVSWLSETAGATAGVVLRCVEANEKADALPIGLAVGVVYHAQARGKLEKAAGKMEERFLGRSVPDDAAIERWSAAAEEVVRVQITEPRLKASLLARADEILRAVGADELAHLSATSPLGFGQRLARCGNALARILTARPESPSMSSRRRARVAIGDHELAASGCRRLGRRGHGDPLGALARSGGESSASRATIARRGGWSITLPMKGASPTGRGSCSGTPATRSASFHEAYAQLFDRVTEMREVLEPASSRSCCELATASEAGALDEADRPRRAGPGERVVGPLAESEAGRCCSS